MKLPLISIVITTKNEEKNIEKCLWSIQKQNFSKKQIEVIIVDNHSVDDTITIARKYTSQIYQKGPERSAQRTIAIAKYAFKKGYYETMQTTIVIPYPGTSLY